MILKLRENSDGYFSGQVVLITFLFRPPEGACHDRPRVYGLPAGVRKFVDAGLKNGKPVRTYRKQRIMIIEFMSSCSHCFALQRCKHQNKIYQ